MGRAIRAEGLGQYSQEHQATKGLKTQAFFPPRRTVTSNDPRSVYMGLDTCDIAENGRNVGTEHGTMVCRTSPPVSGPWMT